jgi:FkbM family methyltransferase
VKHRIPRHEDLIYDVGLHRGQDTDYYLRKGFRVVAFEADPNLVAECRQRFAGAIAENRLTLVEGAITADTGQPTTTFFRHPDRAIWNSIHPDWRAKGLQPVPGLEELEVPTINFAECVRDHGVPHYMKIDIEGADPVCLSALRDVDPVPSYISIESDKASMQGIEHEMELFESLGYTAFKIVQQAAVFRQRPPRPSREGMSIAYRFERDASGMFGEDLPGRWRTKGSALRSYRRIMWRKRVLTRRSGLLSRPLVCRIRNGIQFFTGIPLPGWCDTHARHSSVRPTSR